MTPIEGRYDSARPNDAFDVRMSLRQIAEACRIHAWILLVTPLATLALASIYLLVWPPIYVAQADLLAESDKDSSRDEFYYFWDMFRKEDIKSEVGLMTSDSVLKDVVTRLNLTYDDVYHPFLNHAAYLWTKSLPGRAYHKMKKFVFHRQPNAYEPTDAEADLARTVTDLKEGISITALPDSHVGVLRLKGPTPRVAEIANTFIATLLDHRRDRYIHESTTAYEALKTEADAAKAELTAAEAKRGAYFSAHDMLMEFEKEKIDLSNYTALDASIAEMDSGLAGLRTKRTELMSQLMSEPSETVTTRVEQRNPSRQEVEHERVDLEAALAQALVHLRPDAPEVEDLRRQIAAADGVIKQLPEDIEFSNTRTTGNRDSLRTQLEDTEVQIAAMSSVIEAKKRESAALHKRLLEIPAQIIEVHSMERDESSLEKKYMIIQERLMMAQVSIASARSAPSSVKVIDYAEPPAKPDWPNSKLLCLSAVGLGLFGGIGLAMVLDMLLPRVTASKLRLRAGEFPIFATINGRDRGAALDLRLSSVHNLPLPS